MDLRPYQKEAKDAIEDQWGIVDRTLLVLPTGTGKTIVFCKLAKDCVAAGKRVLILAHRGELLDQAADKMKKATGLDCAVEKAERSCLEVPDCWFRIVVGSIQSMMRPQRLNKFSPGYFDVIIVDEAHHVLANSYRRVLDHFPAAKVLGVTATPDRGDMQNLGEFFESLAYEYSLPRAVKDEYLVRIKALTIPLKLDLSEVGTQAGDFKSRDLGTALDPYLDQIANEMVEHCRGRKTIAFLPLCATAQKFNDLLRDRGLRSYYVSGEDRTSLPAFESDGAGAVLTNAMLVTEGYDHPEVDCIVCLRPTKMRSLYCQMIGRGTRLSTGKKDLLLLDFLWHSERHELCRPAHLIAENKEVANQMVDNMESQAGFIIDLEAAEEKAEIDCIEEREKSLADKLAAMKRRKRKLVDPLQFEMSIQAEDLASYVPAFGWEMGPPSDKQKASLEKMGIMPDEIECAGKAAKIMDRLSKRRAEGLSTPKQIRFLERLGFNHVGQWEKEAASKLVNRIAANNWRLPVGVNPITYQPAETLKSS